MWVHFDLIKFESVITECMDPSLVFFFSCLRIYSQDKNLVCVYFK